MKTKQFAAFLFFAAAMTAFVACDKDDDDETDITADKVAGSYSITYSLATTKYFSNMYTDESGNSVVLTQVGDTTVSVAFTSSTWGTFAINAGVSVENGVYIISGEGSVEMVAHGETKSYDATVEGTFADGAFTSLVFTAPSVMGGTAITVYNTTVNAAYSVAGEYNGTLSAKIESMGLDCGSVDNQTITITAAEDGTIGVAIPAFTYAKMGTTIPAATLNGIAVAAAEDGSYTIGETEFSETVTVDGAEKTYSGTMSGTISANKKATIVYELKYGKMPMAITFTFETSAE
ncbi:MAG: hypothetical protein J6Y72_00605 [Bacteroidales bacterium]|nr:hypothetical protein [Bacteroidales bacterium]